MSSPTPSRSAFRAPFSPVSTQRPYQSPGIPGHSAGKGWIMDSLSSLTFCHFFFTSLSPAPSLCASPLFWNNITAKSRGYILATLVPAMELQVGRSISQSLSLFDSNKKYPLNYLMEFHNRLTFHLLPPADQSFYLAREIFHHLQDGLAPIFICG